eukprot:m.62203 g.62203  ORF g.62203 m.62203 type:complete len:54 (-) comp8022_c0_seq1:536-697(-)
MSRDINETKMKTDSMNENFKSITNNSTNQLPTTQHINYITLPPAGEMSISIRH